LFRAFQKTAFDIRFMYEANLRDYARGLISFLSLQDIVGALEKLESDVLFPDIEIKNVRVTFHLYEEQPPWPRGAWQDVKVHFVFRDSSPPIICELQLCHQKFTIARRELGGHGVYARFRSLLEAEDFVNATKQ